MCKATGNNLVYRRGHEMYHVQPNVPPENRSNQMRVFRNVCASCVLFASSVLVFAQTAAKPAFEVASIKASAPLATLIAQIRSGAVRPGMSVNGNRFDCQMSLDSLIATAYRTKTDQIGGPDWLSSQRFE